MFCKNCGVELAEGASFCANCGTKTADDQAAVEKTPVAEPAPQQVKYIPVPAEQEIPERYRPIGAWGYFGWNLLFSIPVVGFVFMVIFACGGCKNINLRNYARSFFCAMLIAIALVLVYVIVMVLIALVFGSTTAAAYNSFS